ncbi:glycosyltransferase family 4 protein [Patescibacteria group bacterium]|nr:glycosyltransferase family 4 protein [Patescibacteria group bacterium]
MKILYIITQSELGGAQKNVLDLACGLKGKCEILVAVGADGSGGFFNWLEEKKVSYVKLRWLRRGVTNPLADLMGLREIFKLIKKERPDIVHLHSSKAGFSGSIAAKLLGVKVVYTVHGAVFEAVFSAPVKKLYLWLEKFSAHFIDKIICVSQNDKKLWLKYKAAPEEKLAVVHNGLDYQTLNFLPKDEARENLFGASAPLFEAARGSKPDLKIIGTIANFYPEKGLPYFIQAAEIILKNRLADNLIFVVIGEGDERPLLETMIKENHLEKKFILTGKIDNAARYLKAFDIFILPSVKEGLPYTILEAMAAGVPIVASWVGGIPEMIENGKNGFLVLPHNPEMLAEKIAELLHNHDLTQHFVQNSQIKLTEFSLEKMVSETEALYKNI